MSHSEEKERELLPCGFIGAAFGRLKSSGWMGLKQAADSTLRMRSRAQPGVSVAADNPLSAADRRNQADGRPCSDEFIGAEVHVIIGNRTLLFPRGKRRKRHGCRPERITGGRIVRNLNDDGGGISQVRKGAEESDGDRSHEVMVIIGRAAVNSVEKNRGAGRPR